MPPDLPADPDVVSSDEESITNCLRLVRLGEAGAETLLLGRVYRHLRKMAGQRMRRERADHTLQPTALVNEVWLKLIHTARDVTYADSEHFYAICGRIMRNVLIDHARHFGPGKADMATLPDIAITEQRSIELLAIDAALDRLARFDPRGAKVVELMLIAGFTQKETAVALGISERTVKRDYSACRAWLKKELTGASELPGDNLQPVSP